MKTRTIRTKNIQILIIFIILAIGISSRFINIGTQGILIDETWVVPNTNFHFGEKSIFPKLFTYPQFHSFDHSKQELIRTIYNLHPIFQICAIRAASDVHPPLFFVLNYYWSQWFGYSEKIIRTPAAFYFIFTLFLILSILKRQNFDLSKSIILISLVVLSPFYLFLSNFARPYTLLLFLALLSSYLSYELVLTDFKGRIIFYYIATSVACLYTHYYGTLVIASQAVYLCVESYLSGKIKKNFLKIIIIQIIIGLLFIPWILVIIYQFINRFPDTKHGLEFINLKKILDLILTYGLGYSRSTTYSLINIFTAIVQLILFTNGFIYLFKKRKDINFRFWLFFFIAPMTFIILFNMIQPVFTARYCSIILIPYLAICTFGFLAIRKITYNIFISIILGSVGLYFIFYGLSFGNVKGEGAMEDWKSTANFIKKIDKVPPVYVYHPSYLDTLYYYIPDKNKIRGLREKMWEEGPGDQKFILVQMKPSEDPSTEKIVKDLPFLKNSKFFSTKKPVKNLPFLKNSELFDVKLLSYFPHIYIYEIEKNK